MTLRKFVNGDREMFRVSDLTVSGRFLDILGFKKEFVEA